VITLCVVACSGAPSPAPVAPAPVKIDWERVDYDLAAALMFLAEIPDATATARAEISAARLDVTQRFASFSSRDYLFNTYVVDGQVPPTPRERTLEFLGNAAQLLAPAASDAIARSVLTHINAASRALR